MGKQSVDAKTLLISYRYLRAAMVGLVVWLAISVIFQTKEQGDSLGSISAYYYTPAQAVFVGALISLGVCMIVIRGVFDAEDVLLNIAGMLAPVVALVPTARSEDFSKLSEVCKQHGDVPWADASQASKCFAVDIIEGTVRAYVSNNMEALLWVGALGLVVAFVLAFVEKGGLSATTGVGFACAVAVYVVGWAAFIFHRDWFIHNAHYWAAGLMFTCIVGVALANAFRVHQAREKLRGRSAGSDGSRVKALSATRILRDVYALIALLMVVALVGGGILIFHEAYDKVVLHTEGVLISLFAAFWLTQTLESWRLTRSEPG